MKKYYLADLFTLLEVILAVALFVMAFTEHPVEWALYAFIAGEICDAVDGPCARTWHYPNDGKYRWWRQYNSEIDQVSDILLGVACGIFLILRTSWILGLILLGGIGIFCLIIQAYLYRYDSGRHEFTQREPLYRYDFKHRKVVQCSKKDVDNIVLFRRRVYVIAGVGGAIAVLIWYTAWAFRVKLTLSIIGVIIGFIVFLLKKKRWNENKTAL